METLRRKLPILPANHKIITMGILEDGSRIANFRGSSWSVMDLRATFAGIPKYRLGEQLKGMRDVRAWKPGILVLAPEGSSDVRKV